MKATIDEMKKLVIGCSALAMNGVQLEDLKKIKNRNDALLYLKSDEPYTRLFCRDVINGEFVLTLSGQRIKIYLEEKE